MCDSDIDCFCKLLDITRQTVRKYTTTVSGLGLSCIVCKSCREDKARGFILSIPNTQGDCLYDIMLVYILCACFCLYCLLYKEMLFFEIFVLLCLEERKKKFKKALISRKGHTY